MKLHRFHPAALLAALCLSGCGTDQSLNFAETLVIGIAGSFDQPEGATGNAEPRNLTLTLEGVTATAATAGVVNLFAEEPLTIVVASRSQILFETDLGEYVDDTITELQLTFKAEGVAKGKHQDEIAFTLTQPVLIHTESFVIKPAQKKRVDVMVQWRNIVSRDETVVPPTETMTPPALATKLVN